MDLLLLPDFLAMCLLVGVLRAVQGRGRHDSLRLWTGALILIILETIARFIYEMKTGLLVHQLSHTLALESYLFAGALFLRSASTSRRRMARSKIFLWGNIAPHAVLIAVYCAGIRAPEAYYALFATGYLLGAGISLWLRRPGYYPLAFLGIWLPLAVFVYFQQIHFVPYFVLFLLYLFSGIGFTESLPRGSRGMIAVSVGLLLWSLCFLTHPWVADYHPAWVPFAARVWDLQKFIITVGFLLVLVEQQLRDNEWLALHDELTGLPNRRLFDDRLQYTVARAARDKRRAALFTLDLDGFKAVNDTLGHDAGDIVLKQVTANLAAATRKTDTLARTGGDEFALIAVDIGDGPVGSPGQHPICFPQTERMFESMLRAIELPIELGEAFGHRTVQITASIGVAVYPDDGQDVGMLVRLADRRMYRQKSTREDVRKSGERPKLTAQIA